MFQRAQNHFTWSFARGYNLHGGYSYSNFRALLMSSRTHEETGGKNINKRFTINAVCLKCMANHRTCA